MVALLVVIAALFIWRAVSKISELKKNDGFIIDGDAVNVVLSEKSAPKTAASSGSSTFQYKYYGLFLAD